MNGEQPARPARTASDVPLIGRLVGRHRQHLVARALAGVCRRYQSWYGNVNYDLESNGEGFVLDTLAGFSPRVIFDVGANVGDWSQAAASRCPGAVVLAFEIAPPTFEILRERTRHVRAIECRPFGLSDGDGTVSLRHFAGAPALTTASEYPHPLPSISIEGKTRRGDDYAAEAGVERIDFLKIDVEGMEEHVLRGFSAMFEREAIDVVQFEYGRVNILNHFLLRDAYDFFKARGFAVGKIYPSYVDFRDYALADEDFLGPNFLACRVARPDYVRALGRSR